jgi:dihydrofolate synthase/folylpolyglutamate synthase
MDYNQTLNFLITRLPIYQRIGRVAYKKDIGNIISACKKLKNPQNKFKSIHIAGTNGKGSVAHILASILQESGYSTGLYTSPHLKDFRERIKINGNIISKKKVNDFVSINKNTFLKLQMSFFEMTVALAFNHFANEKVDIAIIETGLGGRLDSTNIINPIISIITNIGLDHTKLLGDSIEKIAKEKAGIIKNNTPIIIGSRQKNVEYIFREVSESKNAEIYFSDIIPNYKTDLKGNYQKRNISTALKSIEILRKLNWTISENNINDGLMNIVKNTGLYGRWQIISKKPLTICDTAHNIDGIKHIIQELKNTPHNNLHFVFGTVNDKETDSILSLLPKNALYYLCKANIERAMDTNILYKKAKNLDLNCSSFASVKEALAAAKKAAKNKDLILISGSTFVVAEVL